MSDLVERVARAIDDAAGTHSEDVSCWHDHARAAIAVVSGEAEKTAQADEAEACDRAREEEREACAKVAEAMRPQRALYSRDVDTACLEIAAAIRELTVPAKEGEEGT